MSEFTPPSPIRRANVRLGDAPAPKRGRDPFVARVGALVLVGLLGIPIVAALNRDGGQSVEAQPTGGAAALLATGGGEGSIALVDGSTTTVAAPAPTVAAQSGAIALVDPAATTSPVTQPPASASATAPAATAASAATAATTAAQPAAATEPAATAPAATEPVCAGEYVVAEGDYWIGIADRAGVATSELLAANGASSDTAIYPGRSICLPAGADDPGPPPAPTTTTQAPATTTTAKPTTTTTQAPATTAKPATTAAPTTTAKPTTTTAPKSYSADEVESIIRSVFPADLADDAVAIARRESNLKPGVRNWCCYGLFQIKWDSHQSWLAGMGITTPEQLYDPLLNAQAGLMLYMRAGGWGPWGGPPS